MYIITLTIRHLRVQFPKHFLVSKMFIDIVYHYICCKYYCELNNILCFYSNAKTNLRLLFNHGQITLKYEYAVQCNKGSQWLDIIKKIWENIYCRAHDKIYYKQNYATYTHILIKPLVFVNIITVRFFEV